MAAGKTARLTSYLLYTVEVVIDMDTNELNDPFLTDDDDSTSSAWSDSMADESPAETGETDSLDVAPGASTQRSALALLVACGVAVVAIYLLGLQHRPKESSAEELAADARLELALAKLLAERSGGQKMDKASTSELLVETFYDHPAGQQVSLSELACSPFSMPVDPMLQSNAEQQQSQYETTRMQKLREQASQMTLQSIVTSDQGSQCMIDGEVLSMGDGVDDTFVVVSIDKDGVVIAADRHSFLLQM